MVNNTSENLVFNQTDLHCVFHVVDLTLWDNKAFVVVDSNFQTMLKKSNILLLLMWPRSYRWLQLLLQSQEWEGNTPSPFFLFGVILFSCSFFSVPIDHVLVFKFKFTLQIFVVYSKIIMNFADICLLDWCNFLIDFSCLLFQLWSLGNL